MKSLFVWTAILAWMTVGEPIATASPAGCSVNLPAGTVIRIFPDEKITAGSSSGPVVFTVGSDVRFVPNRPSLLSKGSKILGQIVESQEAGRLVGKAQAHIILTSILTADLCEYPIDAKILAAGRFDAEDNVVLGRGHANRDALLLLFPPTTIYQVLRIPGRGPKLVLDSETPLTIKLMQPLHPEQALSSSSEGESALRARIDQLERRILNLETAVGSKTPSSWDGEPRFLFSAACEATVTAPSGPITYKDTVLRPVRNLTPYHVRLHLNGRPVAAFPPCYGSMVPMPSYPFYLESFASLLTTEGQSQVEVKVVPNTDENGWDIVWADRLVPAGPDR